jgi:hypothetical protein
MDEVGGILLADGRECKALNGFRAEVEVANDPELARRQVRVVRNFLLALSTRVGQSNSCAHVGPNLRRYGSPAACSESQ